MRTFSGFQSSQYITAETYSVTERKRYFSSDHYLNSDNSGIQPASSDLPMSNVYVSGQVKADFPNIGLRREFERCLLSITNGGNNSQYLATDTGTPLRKRKDLNELKKSLYTLFSKPQFTYVARDMSWTLMDAYGNDIYHLDSSETQLNELVKAIEPTDRNVPQAVTILGETTLRSENNIPSITIRKVETVTPSSIINTINSQIPGMDDNNLKKTVAEILTLGENEGYTNEDRALNYCLDHNMKIYIGAYEVLNNSNSSTSSPTAQLSNIYVALQVSGSRRVAKVIFTFQNIEGGGTQSWYSAVDVTDEYPFLLVGFKRFLQRSFI